MTNSTYGDPKLFDLQKQIHDKAIKSKNWKSPMFKETRTGVQD